MTTDSILPLTVDSAMAATLEPLDDPMIDLESILLSGDASVHQTDLLSGLIETDEDFLNELLNPSSSSLSSSPNQLTAHSSTCYYPSPTSSSPYSHQLQQDGSGSPYQVNAFTFTHSSPLSASSIEQYSPTGCWSGEGHNNSPSLDSPLGTDVHINVEDISCPKDEATSSSSRKTGSLILSEEEKRLLAEEGIHLPTDMPLTKAEERHLKRIRRKIKNKQSAADSRKRKKEYVDGLEKRVERCTAENLKYKKKIDSLQAENKSLLSQLHKLQAIVSQYSPSKVQAGSFLMVFILSFSILIVPNLFGTHSDVASSNGVSRTLLNVEADEFGNVIDPISGKAVYDYISPVPLPPWKFQSPLVTN